MTARHETIELLARQIALSEGRTFNKLDAKNQMRLATLAENMVATVERKMRAQSKGLAHWLKTDWDLPA